MITWVTRGRPSRATEPPNTVRPVRTSRPPSFTQSTHWTPTAAGRWHSGQTGRSQRWHRTYDTRSGWRGQTGSAAVLAGSLLTDVQLLSCVELALLDRDPLDHDRLDGAVHGTRGRAADRVDDLATRLVGHLAEDRVLALQVHLGTHRDEELRTVGAVPAALACV